MCLDIKNRFTYPVQAEEDIICYKVVLGPYFDNKNKVNFRSVYYNFEYKLNGIYREPTFVYYPIIPKIFKGFHSYKELSTAEIVESNCSNIVSILKCKIPKNASYYESKDGDQYCSNKIEILAWKKLRDRTLNVRRRSVFQIIRNIFNKI